MIYFTRSGDAVKIGHTNNPDLRMQTFRIANPNSIVVLGVMDGGEREEKELHAAFARHHIRGEWFVLCGEIIRFIEANCRPYLAGVKRIGIGAPPQPRIETDRTLRVLTWIYAPLALALGAAYTIEVTLFDVIPHSGPFWFIPIGLISTPVGLALFARVMWLNCADGLAEYRYRRAVKMCAR